MKIDEIISGQYVSYFDGDDYLDLDGTFTIKDLKKLIVFLEENQEKQYILTVKPAAPSNTRLDWILEAIEKINGIKVYYKNQYNSFDSVSANLKQIESIRAGWGALLDINEVFFDLRS